MKLQPRMIEFGSGGMMRKGRIIASLARSNRASDTDATWEAMRRLSIKQKIGQGRAKGNWEKEKLAQANKFRVSAFVARLGIRRPAG